MGHRLPGVLGALFGLVLPASAWPCTTFLLERPGGIAVGKSYDWSQGAGMVVVNKAGVAKRALAFAPSDQPAAWVSEHASLTFNQYGREMPNGGMNDAGLVVEVMWFAASRFPPPDERPTVTELQYVQWLLDRFATVEEVVAHAGEVRVAMVYGRIHYLACDRLGACAALEFVQGKLVTTSTTGAKPGMRARTLTNNSYADAVRALGSMEGFGGKGRPRPGTGSLDRFARASVMAARAPDGLRPVDEAFAILDAVSMGEYSKWNVVYEPGAMKVHFRTRGHRAVKTVDLARFERGCGTAVKVLDIDTDEGGDATARFVDYSTAANAALLEKVAAELRERIPASAVEAASRYPEMLPCAEREARQPGLPRQPP